VARARAQRLGQPPHLLRLRFGEQAHAKQPGRLLAFAAPLVVSRARMGVALAGVHYHQSPAAESERHRLDRQHREVDQQRCVGFAEQRRELVEQARSRANPLALHARAQLRDLQAVKLGAVDRAAR